MTDAFTDIIEDDGDDGGSDDGTVTTSEETVTDFFSDDVRTNIPEDDERLDTKQYEDPESDNQAGDVDPRGLFATPSLNDIRYYAREGPHGKTIVEKPIRDAFKHGFEIVGEDIGDGNADQIKQFIVEELLAGNESTTQQARREGPYRLAEFKSRRDGIAILMHQIADSAQSVSAPIPESGGTFEGFDLFTADNLSDALAASEVADHTDFETDQIYVSEGAEHGGVAIVDDISHPRNGDILGYGIEPRKDSSDLHDVQFVHADRCHHFVHGEYVDGNLGNDVTGRHVGESILTPVLQPLMATQMGYWAMKNILHRYSAPLHAVEPPEQWGSDEFDDARQKMGNLSMQSEAVLPPGSNLTVAEGVTEFDPEPYYDVLTEAICSGTIFTKTVLQGTQTGTVSGSETDMKGYFNGIHLLRQQQIAPWWRAIVQKVASYDQQTIPRSAAFDDWDVEWGPLFKPTDIEQAEGAVSLITAATNGIKNYVLTPDEARSLVEEEWATFDIDIELDELTEADRDALDRINIREVGRGPKDDEPVSNEGGVRQNPRMQNGGGQPDGQTRESSQPTRDSASEIRDVIDDALDERLDDAQTDDAGTANE